MEFRFVPEGIVCGADGDDRPAVASGRLDGRPPVAGRVEGIHCDPIRGHREYDLRRDSLAEDRCLAPTIAQGEAFPVASPKLGSLVLNQSPWPR